MNDSDNKVNGAPTDDWQLLYVKDGVETYWRREADRKEFKPALDMTATYPVYSIIKRPCKKSD
jgi:hypothetical protein